MTTPVPGLRHHRRPFLWLALNVALVGATLGVERTVVPLLGHHVYHVGSAVALTFISSFGLAKALINLGAGRWSDRVGRLPVLRLGWLMGVPMVALLLGVHAWWAVIVANVFLGANQGLAWTMTINAQLDLVTTSERGLAMGINEGMGYLGVAGATIASGFLGAHGHLLTRPFWLTCAIVVTGGAISFGVLRETHGPVKSETAPPRTPMRQLFAETTWIHPALSSMTAGGFVNKLADTTAWGVLPLYFASQHLTLPAISVVAGVYGGVWGAGQFATGLYSDHVGRKPLIVGGLLLLAVGLAGTAWLHGFGSWLAMAALMGVGMAMVYPVLNAAVADVAPPENRGAIVGVYRLWRDGGYAVGGILLGVLGATLGARGSIVLVAALVVLATGLIALRMPETHLSP